LIAVIVAMQRTGHRDPFTLIRYADRGIIWLNLLTLFAVCLLQRVRLGAAQPLLRGPAGAASVRPDLDGHVRHPDRHLGLCDTEAIPGARAPGPGVDPVRAGAVRLSLLVFIAAFAIAAVSPQASLAVYASAPVLYFIAITLLRWLAPRGSAERQFT
jgi:hypothetical protein